MKDISINNFLRVPDIGENQKLIQALQEKATVPNPDYLTRLKYNRSMRVKGKDGKWSSVQKELKLWCISRDKLGRNVFCFPAGMRAFCPALEAKIWAGEPVEFVDSRGIQSRDYQEEAIEEMIRQGYGIAVMPTGGGKTEVGMQILSGIKRRALIIVHTKLLFNQWRERIKKAFPGIPIGEIGDGKDLHGAVTIGIINSVVKKIKEPESVEWRKRYGIIIIDECHRAGAETYKFVLESLPGFYKFGFTATLLRSDGNEILPELLIGPVRYEIDSAPLQEAGYIMKPGLKIIKTDFIWEDEDLLLFDRLKFLTQNFKPVGKRIVFPRIFLEKLQAKPEQFKRLKINLVGADNASFDPTLKLIMNHSKMIDALQEDETRNRLIIEKVQKIIPEKTGQEIILVVSDRKKHLWNLFNLLSEENQKISRVIIGDTKEKERDEISELIREKKIKILFSTVPLIGEGYDCIGFSDIFLASPLKFKGRTTQTIGRIVRVYQDKKQPVIWDFFDFLMPIMKNKFRERRKAYAEMNAEEV